jgi:arylsulfatase
MALGVAAVALTAAAGVYMHERRRFPVEQAVARLSPAARGPNVVLVTMDTVRADHTSMSGYERQTTPRLEQLATEATVYRQAYSTADATLMTHASMFSGLYPQQHGAYCAPPAYRWGRRLSNRFPTLAGILASHGYSTMAFPANSGYVVPEFGLAQGFQLFDVNHVIPIQPRGDPLLVRATLRSLLHHFVPTQDFDICYRRADEVNREVFVALDEMKKKRGSFFLFANYMDAHDPYVPPAPFDHRYWNGSRKMTFDEYLNLEDAVLSGRRQVSEEERRLLISQYDGALAYEDSQIGRLLDRLKQQGDYDNSLIIITADHGEAFGDRQIVGHPGTVHQEMTHVPLIVKYPGSRQARVVDRPASQIDLLPTVLATLGIAPPPGLPGVDLRTVGQVPPRALVATSYPCMSEYPRFARIETGLISEGMKYIVSSTGEQHLYDLAKDPEERTDLYRPGDARVHTASNEFAKWLRETPQFHDTVKADPVALGRLKSLGYVQ